MFDVVIAIVQTSSIIWFAIFGTLLVICIPLYITALLAEKFIGYRTGRHGHRATFDEMTERLYNEAVDFHDPITMPLEFRVPITNQIPIILPYPPLEQEIDWAMRMGANTGDLDQDAKIYQFQLKGVHRERR